MKRAEAPSRPVRFRLSPAEREVTERAAKVNGQNLSEFIRDATLTAASECLEGVTAPSRRGAVVVLNAPR